MGHVLKKDARRTSLCHSTYLDTYGEKESWPPQYNLAPYCGERKGIGGLEVLGGIEARVLVNDRS